MTFNAKNPQKLHPEHPEVDTVKSNFQFGSPHELFRQDIWRHENVDSIHELLHLRLFGVSRREARLQGIELSPYQNSLYSLAWQNTVAFVDDIVKDCIYHSDPEFPEAEDIVDEMIDCLLTACPERFEAAGVHIS